MISRVKPTASGVLQASKWLSYPVLIDADEMQALFDELRDFEIYLVSGVSKRGEGRISKEAFLQLYRAYIEALREGILLPESAYRSVFSSVFTATSDALFAVPIEPDKQLIKIEKPVIQLQSHRISYSSVDGKFRSMVWGPDSITWGIQFSYPQIFQHAETKQVIQVAETTDFPNTALFRRLQRWGRHHTTATPFLVEGERINVPVRLGKQCFSWINRHPQLIEKKLSVLTAKR
jgi:hypothetical protein